MPEFSEGGFSPEEAETKSKSSEPVSAAPSEMIEHHAPQRGEVDEDAILHEVRVRDKKRVELLEGAELQLRLALAENPQQLQKDNRPIGEERDAPSRRLFDLEVSLAELEKFKDQLPKRYKAATDKVVEEAEFVKKILEDYRSWAQDEARDSRFVIKESLLGILLKLRRIDPDHFPQDLADFTDEEFRLMALPQVRWYWDGLLREAKLAEYDPDRFRRLFGHQYPARRIAEERAAWARIDQENQNLSNGPNCTKAWETIERALQKTGQEAIGV